MAPTKIIVPKSLLKTITKPLPETVVVEADTEQRPSSPHTSYTQLGMFLRCGRQYMYRYMLGLKEPPKVSLSIGKGGHAALEYNTKTKIRTGTDAPVEKVIQKASDMMDHYLSELPPSEIEVDVEPGSTKDKFLSATRIYMTRDAPAIKPIGAEIEFNLDLNEFLPADNDPLPEPIRIANGKIDVAYDDLGIRLAHKEAVRVGIEDYKYVTKKQAQAAVDMSPQLTLYGVVMHKLTGRWPTKLGIRMMHPGTTKEPPNSIVLTRSPNQMTPDALQRRMARLVYQFQKMEEAIRHGIFIPTDNPITCSWCGFREKCQNSLVNEYEAATIRQSTSPNPLNS